MNAGKTTTLLQSAHTRRAQVMRVVLATPSGWTIVPAPAVASRIGLQAEATAFDADTDLQVLIECDLAVAQAAGCVGRMKGAHS